MTESLRPTAFKGEPDIEDLHSFFLPDLHFAGDTLWTFGTSLKSAYVNSFEFLHHAPVVQLWREQDGAVQAVSRISLGTGEWFHLALPAYRTGEVAAALILQADTSFGLLTDRGYWETVRYESKTAEINELEQAGYTRAGVAEVYMTRSLEHAIEGVACPEGVHVGLLNPADPHERAMAQVDAFTDGEPSTAETAWITRSIPHQLSYGRPHSHSSVIAFDQAGRVEAFADPFYDRTNRIGEFEPVGTRKSSQRKGLSKVVLTRGLQEMRNNGMSRAVVRTGFDNHAAIAAYESVGFETTDLLIRLRKQRST
jgi:GNAT superfamily N-acetyltransferase